MEKANAIQILNSRKLITEPGKYQLKVTNVTPFTRSDTDIMIHICNYAGLTPYQAAQARELMKAGEFQEATNQSLSSSQRIGQDYQPTKGELVGVTVDWVMTKGDDENPPVKALLVVNVSEIKIKESSNFNFVDEEDEASLIDEETAREVNIANETTKAKSAKAAGAEAEMPEA